MSEAASIISLPWQTGELPLMRGAGGKGFTVAKTDEGREEQPLTVAVTEYVPELGRPALVTDGFCTKEAKPFGPVQL